jgi:hypothetical protein
MFRAEVRNVILSSIAHQSLFNLAGRPSHGHQCTQTVLQEVGHIRVTRSTAEPLAVKPLEPEAQGWAVNPVYCVGDGPTVAGSGTRIKRHRGRSEMGPGSLARGCQTLQQRTALGRRTLWRAGLWSERTQPAADAGPSERASEAVRSQGLHAKRANRGRRTSSLGLSLRAELKRREAPDTAEPCWVGRRSAEWAPRRGGEFGQISSCDSEFDNSKLANVKRQNCQCSSP